jgi:hypothetical protein
MAQLRHPRNKNLKLAKVDIDSQLNKFSSQTLAHQSLQFPIQLRKMTKEETKEYYLKKFAQWGKRWEKGQKGELAFGVDRNVYHNGELVAEDPNYEEKQWVIYKIKATERAWQRWYIGLYFTEEQKKQLGLTDKDIAGKGMA